MSRYPYNITNNNDNDLLMMIKIIISRWKVDVPVKLDDPVSRSWVIRIMKRMIRLLRNRMIQMNPNDPLHEADDPLHEVGSSGFMIRITRLRDTGTSGFLKLDYLASRSRIIQLHWDINFPPTVICLLY